MEKTRERLANQFIHGQGHSGNDYFGLIKAMLKERSAQPFGSGPYIFWQEAIAAVYLQVREEILDNDQPPRTSVLFGTSGWRGILGKDITRKSVAQVTTAIVRLYQGMAAEPAATVAALGVGSLEEAQRQGCVVGHDNRYCGDLLTRTAIDILTGHGFRVYDAGEATTGTLSAALLRKQAAFSINLTPSHNPLEYGGFKYNAADGGPAASALTNRITQLAHAIISQDEPIAVTPAPGLVEKIDSLAQWVDLVTANWNHHGLDYHDIIARFEQDRDLVVVIDCVHGASRIHLQRFFKDSHCGRLVLLRDNDDPTFGGIAPEPSTTNLQGVRDVLARRPEPIKLGAIIDPDADRIRFTDGTTDITMNHFGAMAYHYLHEIKKKRGVVAKTVATSNFANVLAARFGEEVFEPRVGFKEFKPVIGKALVFFEESDGISLIGHTPEKDAYIGLLIALDMALTLRLSLGDYLRQIEAQFGAFFPARDSVAVTRSGAELTTALQRLTCYQPGGMVRVGRGEKRIACVIDIDGYKMIFSDESWIMIRPSGTEPKVRFYVEGRNHEEESILLGAAKAMLGEIGLLGLSGD